MVQAQAAQIAVLVAENEALKKRVAELEERLNEPGKMPGNSSVPPCKSLKVCFGVENWFFRTFGAVTPRTQKVTSALIA
jgi:hypothetical protein